ncbi:biotin ligase 3 [Cavenderia fasciculata]|uniref:Biotin ligase 3 n=1 Tax=Cavenderia fasciculata TaxID=261658 RepID=F4PLI0_CACFS|nr:biotin ligase 3 [Cavenderia fasciculata]EGG23402.1 biotin ligase 3 [Cavenderia fasciculata]|eukprot:XP_004361253.1 biotin ligase 3 [Cavenderia fasciculata]
MLLFKGVGLTYNSYRPLVTFLISIVPPLSSQSSKYCSTTKEKIKRIIFINKEKMTSSNNEHAYLYADPPIRCDDVKRMFATPQYPGQPVSTIMETTTTLKPQEAVVNSGGGVVQDQFSLYIASEEDANTQSSIPTAFHVKDYFKNLSTILYGKCLIYGQHLSSTQKLMLKYFTYTTPGLVMVADLQNSAVGRGQNMWTSPQGCLVFSFKCRESDGSKLPFLQYVSGLALVKAVDSICPKMKEPVRLKWPNDVYCGGKKIGGILCQSNYFGGSFDVVIGIGINVTNSEPSTCLDAQASQTGLFTRELVLARFMKEFESLYLTFTQNGFKPMQQDYLRAWMHSGQIVKLESQNITVRVEGLADNGYLLARECNANGHVGATSYELHPDGTSFDINQLTLKKKEPIQ